MKPYYFLDYEDIKAIQNWHKNLDGNRGDRARLRRAENPEDILLTEAFAHFLHAMPESKTWRDELSISACVAGALSQVKADKQSNSLIHNKKSSEQAKVIASFAEQLATPPLEGKSKAP